jgi:hypothetical protein
MSGYGRTAESALIAGRRDDDHTAPDGLIQRLFERPYPVDGRLRQSEAEVDDARPRIDTFDDRRGELLGRCTRDVLAARDCFVEYGPYQEGAVGTNGGRWGTSLRRQYSRDKSPMHARRTVGICARGFPICGNLVEVFAFKVEMLDSNRPSISPIFSSGLPRLRSINGASLTKSNGSSVR